MEEGKGAAAPWDTTADGDEAESVRVRFRERVSGPCWEDGEVESAGHPPGGGWLRRSLSFVPLHGKVPLARYMDSLRESFIRNNSLGLSP